MNKDLKKIRRKDTKEHTTYTVKGSILMEIHMITSREDLSLLLEFMQAHKAFKDKMISYQSHTRKSTKWATIAINHLSDNINTDLWVTKTKIMNQCLPT